MTSISLQENTGSICLNIYEDVAFITYVYPVLEGGFNVMLIMQFIIKARAEYNTMHIAIQYFKIIFIVVLKSISIDISLYVISFLSRLRYLYLVFNINTRILLVLPIPICIDAVKMNR